mgnify:CR=1 FL=1
MCEEIFKFLVLSFDRTRPESVKEQLITPCTSYMTGAFTKTISEDVEETVNEQILENENPLQGMQSSNQGENLDQSSSAPVPNDTSSFYWFDSFLRDNIRVIFSASFVLMNTKRIKEFIKILPSIPDRAMKILKKCLLFVLIFILFIEATKFAWKEINIFENSA